MECYKNYLNDKLIKFVKSHSKGFVQRDKKWYELMGRTVGGSEIGSIMDINPYSSFKKVVEEKVKIIKGTHKQINNIACWWGTLFEDVINDYISIVIGGKIYGDDICIEKYIGHRNSPDGYIVADIYIDEDDGPQVKFINDECEEKTFPAILLLEFKCPLTRTPNGTLEYYKMQVLSGLDVSEIAYKGLFIDSVFRKCSFENLCDNEYYDTNFHNKDEKEYRLPLAIGGIVILSNFENDIAKKIYYEHFNYEKDLGEYPIDFGKCENRIFKQVVENIINKQFKVDRYISLDLDNKKNIVEYCNQSEKSENYYILGIIPWKLLEVNYDLINREDNFINNIMPTIQRVHSEVELLLRASNNL